MDIHPFAIPFTTPLRTSARTFFHREGFLIRLQADDVWGTGEAAPLTGISPDSSGECLDCLEEFRQRVNHLSAPVTAEGLISISEEVCSLSPAAEFGIETAVFDAASQQAGLSLAKYLSSHFTADVPVNGLYRKGYSPPPGVAVTKLKVLSGMFSKTVQLVEQLACRYGNDHRFRLDINGGWKLTEAVVNCKQLEGLPIDYIEQPLPPERLDLLAELRKSTSIPIAVDESLKSVEQAKKIIEFEAADVFIIKPMILGGFSSVREIVETANLNRIRCVVTTSLETAVGRSAVLHLAAALRMTEPCGLDTGYLYSRDVAAFPPVVNGMITIPASPGLGIKRLSLPEKLK